MERQCHFGYSYAAAQRIKVLIGMAHNKDLICTGHQFVNGLRHNTGPYPGIFGLHAAPGTVKIGVIAQLHHSLIAATAQG